MFLQGRCLLWEPYLHCTHSWILFQPLWCVGPTVTHFLFGGEGVGAQTLWSKSQARCHCFYNHWFGMNFRLNYRLLFFAFLIFSLCACVVYGECSQNFREKRVHTCLRIWQFFPLEWVMLNYRLFFFCIFDCILCACMVYGECSQSFREKRVHTCLRIRQFFALGWVSRFKKKKGISR